MMIEFGMLVTCCMQCGISLSLLLLFTACVSVLRSVQVLLPGEWAVINLFLRVFVRFDIICVNVCFNVSASICCIFRFLGAEDRKRWFRDSMWFVACI